MSTPPELTVRYTVEELTVIADLYDLPSLPGCRPASLTKSTRSLATRSLIARNVLAMPPGGGIEIQQPHATLIGTLFDADHVIQHIRHRPKQSTVEQWFSTDACTVQVFEMEGIVSMSLYEGRVNPDLGDGQPLDEMPAESTLAAFDEIIELQRSGSTTTVDRRLVAR